MIAPVTPRQYSVPLSRRGEHHYAIRPRKLGRRSDIRRGRTDAAELDGRARGRFVPEQRVDVADACLERLDLHIELSSLRFECVALRIQPLALGAKDGAEAVVGNGRGTLPR